MSSTPPSTMKALVYDTYGDINVLRIENAMETPKITKPGQVLIKVKAASLNPVDYKIRNGAMRLISKAPSYPITIGKDCAGIVVAVSDDVQHLKPGNKVIVDGNPGSLAEYYVAPSSQCGKIPDNVEDFTKYVTLPLAGETALQGLRHLGLKAGESILICGGAGGVGTFAVQLAAKVFGASVVAVTASEAKFDLMKKLGATHMINYKTLIPSLQAHGEKFDHIFDCSGDALQVAPFLKPSAKLLLSIAAMPDPGSFERVGISVPFFVRWYLAWKSRSLQHATNNRYQYMWTKANTKDTEELVTLFNEGKIDPVIDMVINGLDKAVEGFKRLESGRTTGKIVILI
jgi:NADPH:quinone reductase-like Zn-dependent oxidoreductase